jgi:hypothetical protein
MEASILISLFCQTLIPLNGDISANSTDANLIITWTNFSAPSTTEIWKSVNGGTFVRIASVAGNLSTFTDTSVMHDGDLFTYKLRSIRPGLASDFSPTFSAIKNFTAAVGVVIINFPDVVFCDGNIIAGIPTLKSISFPLLHTITGGTGIDIFGCPLLSSVNLNSLITSGGQVAVNTASSVLKSLSFPSLVSSLTSLDISNNPALTSFSAPLWQGSGNFMASNSSALPSISLPACIGTNDFKVDGCTALTSLSVPLLQNTNVTNISNTGLKTLSMPQLISTGDVTNFDNNPSLTSILLPQFQVFGFTASISGNAVLTSISMPMFNVSSSDLTISNNTLLPSISFPNLQQLQASLFIESNSALTSISLISLTLVGTNISADSNAALTTWTSPLLVTISPNNTFTWHGDGLHQASVDEILQDMVNTGTFTCTLDLAGGTNSAPNAGGLANKVILVGNGWIVTNN